MNKTLHVLPLDAVRKLMNKELNVDVLIKDRWVVFPAKNTLQYKLNKLHQLTGLNPRSMEGSALYYFDGEPDDLGALYRRPDGGFRECDDLHRGKTAFKRIRCDHDFHKGTAVVEMAQASGLILLNEEELDPLRATTYGTGELIRHALDRGCRRFIIGIGGSGPIGPAPRPRAEALFPPGPGSELPGPGPCQRSIPKRSPILWGERSRQATVSCLTAPLSLKWPRPAD